MSILALLIASAVYATAAPSRNRRFENDSTGIELVRHGPKPVPIPISARELYEREDIRRRLVSVEGTVHARIVEVRRRHVVAYAEVFRSAPSCAQSRPPDSSPISSRSIHRRKMRSPCRS